MNAYELADELLRDNTQLTVKAAYMLRQQADRIAELEKLLEHSVGSDCREMRYIQEIENKDARIAELEKQGEPVAWMLADKQNECIRSIMAVQHDFVPKGCVEIPLYTTPQTKPLSDEEIDSIIYSVDWAYDPVLLARAIEERHGIK